MASKAVVDAIEARLAANWTACAIVGVNLNDKPTQNDAPFLVVQYPVANEAQASVGAPGANLWREEGAFRIVIHVARTGGVTTGLQWADQLRALFRGQSFDGVETFAPSPPVIDDRNETGNFYVLSIAVPYQFDIVG